MMDSSKFKILPSLKINYDSDRLSTHMANGGVVGNKHLKKTLHNYNIGSETEHSIIDDNATVVEVWLESNQALFSNLKMTTIYVCVDSESNRISAVLNTNPFAAVSKWRKHIFVYIVVLEGMGRNTRLIKTQFMPIPTPAVANPNSNGNNNNNNTSSNTSPGHSPTSSTVSLPSSASSMIGSSSGSPTSSLNNFTLDGAGSVGSSANSTSSLNTQSFSSTSSITSAGNMNANNNGQQQQQQQVPNFISFINNVIHKVTPPPQIQTLIENIQYLLIQSMQRALSNFVNSIQRDRLYYNQVISYKKNEGMYLPTLFLAQAGLSPNVSPISTPPVYGSTLSIPSSNGSSFSSPALSSSPNSSVMFLPISSSPSLQSTFNTSEMSPALQSATPENQVSVSDEEDSNSSCSIGSSSSASGSGSNNNISSSPSNDNENNNNTNNNEINNNNNSNNNENNSIESSDETSLSPVNIVVTTTPSITQSTTQSTTMTSLISPTPSTPSIPQTRLLMSYNTIHNIIPSTHYNNFSGKRVVPVLNNPIILGGSRQIVKSVNESSSSTSQQPQPSDKLNTNNNQQQQQNNCINNANNNSNTQSISIPIQTTNSNSNSFMHSKPRGLKQSKELGEKPNLVSYETKDGFGCAIVSSLYGWDFEKKERSGEPFADCFCLTTTPHPNLRAALTVADGSGLGPDAHRAATMAVLGANEYLDNIGSIEITTTNDLLTVLGNAIMEGHMRIIEDEHYQNKEIHKEPKGATTFCIGCLGQTKNILQNLSSSSSSSTVNVSASLSSANGKKVSRDLRAQQFSRPLPPPPPKGKSTLSIPNSNDGSSMEGKRRNSFSEIQNNNNNDNVYNNQQQQENDEEEIENNNDISEYDDFGAPEISINELPTKVESILNDIKSLDLESKSNRLSTHSDVSEKTPRTPRTPREEEIEEEQQEQEYSPRDSNHQEQQLPKSPRQQEQEHSPRETNHQEQQQTQEIQNDNSINQQQQQQFVDNQSIKKVKPIPPPRNFKTQISSSTSTTSISSLSSMETVSSSASSSPNAYPRLASTDGQWFFMVGSVGDCRAFRWSCATKKVTEITNVKPTRNFNDAGGQLGWMWGGDDGQIWPYNAIDYPNDPRPEWRDELIKAKNEKSRPHLKNLHFGLVLVNPGDRVFIASDGVTDNFLNMNPTVNEDKVVSKEELESNISNFIKSQPPDVIQSCDRLCQAIITHCLEKTQNFRNIQEDMSKTLVKMKEIEKNGEDLSSDQTYQSLKKNYSKLANSIRHIKYGKPDHSSIVMYEVPFYSNI